MLLSNPDAGKPRPIEDVAAALHLKEADLEHYGKFMAKISWPTLQRQINSHKSRGKLILVTAITPTKSGEGKTTIAIGLAEALWMAGQKAVLALREPSLGPVFGMKGGATGGGRCHLLPSEEINLHFTGDMHAITAANNLLAACIDNHIFQGNSLNIDEANIFHRRALDMNDRSLRSILTGLNEKGSEHQRETGFNITAASEVMAILCLSESIEDLKNRLGNMVVAKNRSGEPVRARDIGVVGAMGALLQNAVKPNLVQTNEGTPAFVHGGPFANIAHGCSSVLSIKLALTLADYVITEAGFGSDLGFEKFCDMLAAPSDGVLIPDAVLLTVTIKALKQHGGIAAGDLKKPDAAAVQRGLKNLDSHVDIISQAGVPFVIAVNEFDTDARNEIATVQEYCLQKGWRCAVSDTFEKGGQGGLVLAEETMAAAYDDSSFHSFYDQSEPLAEKLKKLCLKIYGLKDIEYSELATSQRAWLEQHGFSNLPVCVAKSQYSLDGSNGDGVLRVEELRLSAGAGFVVAVTGKIVTMPGLPKHPHALDIDIDDEGRISGLT